MGNTKMQIPGSQPSSQITFQVRRKNNTGNLQKNLTLYKYDLASCFSKCGWSMDQQHGYHLELSRNAESQAPPQTD